MPDRTHYERFLEPVYLNEQMTLNCAAYLFGGVLLGEETNEGEDRQRGIKAAAAIPFLGELLGFPRIEGEYRSGSVTQSRAVYRYTTGGLHMMVLDELKLRQMIQECPADKVAPNIGVGETYVSVHAALRPSDYYALLGTLKILGPLFGQVINDYGDQILSSKAGSIDLESVKLSSDKYVASILALIDKLEKDYLTSKQLEMVMWSAEKGGRPVGVVDLDVTDHDPSELRAKLSGGKYHVIGKVVERVGAGSTLDLMQKTILSNGIDLVQKLFSLQNDQMALTKLRTDFEPVRELIERFVRLDIPGPAVRIAAMSVCL